MASGSGAIRKRSQSQQCLESLWKKSRLADQNVAIEGTGSTYCSEFDSDEPILSDRGSCDSRNATLSISLSTLESGHSSSSSSHAESEIPTEPAADDHLPNGKLHVHVTARLNILTLYVRVLPCRRCQGHGWNACTTSTS